MPSCSKYACRVRRLPAIREPAAAFSRSATNSDSLRALFLKLYLVNLWPKHAWINGRRKQGKRALYALDVETITNLIEAIGNGIPERHQVLVARLFRKRKLYEIRFYNEKALSLGQGGEYTNYSSRIVFSERPV